MTDPSSVEHDPSRRDFLAGATLAAAAAIPAYAAMSTTASATPRATAAPTASDAESVGKAGEVHQTATAGHPDLTTNQGVVIGDDENSLRVGMRGPTSLEDFILREKITHFDHERIPERVVHARGSGAHGFF